MVTRWLIHTADGLAESMRRRSLQQQHLIRRTVVPCRLVLGLPVNAKGQKAWCWPEEAGRLYHTDAASSMRVKGRTHAVYKMLTLWV